LINDVKEKTWSPGKTKARGLQIPSQTGLHSKTLSQKNPKRKEKTPIGMVLPLMLGTLND
jgi:hypothetical protein